MHVCASVDAAIEHFVQVTLASTVLAFEFASNQFRIPLKNPTAGYDGG